MKAKAIPEHIKEYFEETEVSEQYQCKVCSKVKRNKCGSSWAKLNSHLDQKHPDWKMHVEKVRNGGALDAYVDFDGKDYNRF